MNSVRILLDAECEKRNHPAELSTDNPDPLLVARKQFDETSALVCALFSYGSAKQIVSFLSSLHFSVLDTDEQEIEHVLQGKYYRFQTTTDIVRFFRGLWILKQEGGIHESFMRGYKRECNVLEGLSNVIGKLESIIHPDTHGLRFLIGSKEISPSGSPLKRWNMYIRWMVRKDCLDMGLWESSVSRSHLILPLDTHTFHVSARLGLLQRKTYDLQSALLITQKLRTFDPTDPVKYDFALYRLGQSKQA